MIGLIYFFVLIIVGNFYGTEGQVAVYVIRLWFASLLIACIPLASTRIFFLAPIVWFFWCLFFGDAPYGSAFAWQMLLFAPMHWVLIGGLFMDLIRGIFGISKD